MRWIRSRQQGAVARLADAIAYWESGRGNACVEFSKTRVTHLRKILEVLGNVRLDTIGPDHIRKIQSTLRGKNPDLPHRPLSPSYINAMTHHSLRHALYDLDVEFSEKLFCDRRGRTSRLREPKVESTDYWTLEERDIILRTIEERWDRAYVAFIKFAFFTGARLQEITQIQWADMNMDRGECFIRHGKGERSRTITLSGPAMAAVMAVRKGLPTDYVFRTPERSRRPKHRPLGASPTQIAELKLACSTNRQRQVLKALCGGARSVKEAAQKAGLPSTTMQRDFDVLCIRTRLDLKPAQCLKHRRERYFKWANKNPTDSPINLVNFSGRLWRPLMAELSDHVPTYPARCTRHTFAFAMIDAGWKPRVLARHMGNSAEVIMDRYVKLREGLTREQQDEALRAEGSG